MIRALETAALLDTVWLVDTADGKITAVSFNEFADGEATGKYDECIPKTTEASAIRLARRYVKN